MKYTFTTIFFASTFYLSGQGLFDSTQVGLVKGAANTYYDTILNINQYHRFGDFGRDEFGSISMGNQGDVRRMLIFQPLFSLEPNLGIDGYFKNFQKFESLPYYNVRAPSGGVRMLTGYTKGQMFGIFFTVNPISRLNVFVDFQRINSRGRYFNQENKSDQLLISTSYYTKSGVYKFNGGLQFNKASNFEWGGIVDTLDFQNNVFTNRELIPVQLNSSSSVARQLLFTLDQQLRLLKFNTSELTAFYTFRSTGQSHSFTSSDSIFIKNAVFQDAPIRDSIRFTMIENFAGLKWRFEKDSNNISNNHEVVFGVRQFSHIYGNLYSEQIENNLGLEGKYSGIWNRIFWQTDGRLMLSNNFVGTYNLSALGGYSLEGNSYWALGAATQSISPGLFYQRFISNNFIWENELENINWNRFYAIYKHNSWSAKAGVDIMNNYIYFDQSARPKQLNQNLTTYYIEGTGTLPLGASFYLDSRIRYQQASNENVVRMPNWLVREVLYFERNIFGEAARIQTGVEFTYFSRFTSEAYMPATSIMYLQDDIAIGNFPYFNFLFNFKIKEFTFFLRLENITQGLFKYNYFAAPFTPLPDFAIRAGATWRFFN